MKINMAEEICGYLEVKLSNRSKRRGFTPWKVWKKQWCELKRLEGTQNVVEFKICAGPHGAAFSNIIIPRNSILCRTESRSKQYAFGIFSQGNSTKPLLFLSGNSECDTQKWMAQFRKMLANAPFFSAATGTFLVSLIDNEHSRNAKLSGLFGILSTATDGVIISDPFVVSPKFILPWNQLLQCHLAVTNCREDENNICVIHTSSEFVSGAGQLYIYCERAPQLIQQIVLHRRIYRLIPSLSPMYTRRLSRSEGDLCETDSLRDSGISPGSPADSCVLNIRSNSIKKSCLEKIKLSTASDDSGYICKNKTASILAATGLGLLTLTPNTGDHDEDTLGPLGFKSIKENISNNLNRRESGVSIASGIYEEISEEPLAMNSKPQSPNHYENPIELLFSSRRMMCQTPPPLPPRQIQSSMRFDCYSDNALDDLPLTPASFSSLRDTPAKSLPFLPRCHTMPSKNSSLLDLEPQYMPMSPLVQDNYVPMTSSAQKFFPPNESYYMDMSGSNLNVKK